jgi:hypothetical protein
MSDYATRENLKILETVYEKYIEALGGSPDYLAPKAYALNEWQNRCGVKRVHKETLIRQWENGTPLPPEIRKRAEEYGTPCNCLKCKEQQL